MQAIGQDKTCRRLSPGGALALLGLLLLVAVVMGLCCGSHGYTPAQLLAAVLQQDRQSAVWRTLVYSRLPRTLAAVLAGSALAVAGVLVQSVLHNPMASPNIIGVNSGAGFAAMLTAGLFAGGAAGLAVPAASFCGALAASLFIYLLAVRAGLSKTTIILAGVAINSILNAGINALKLLFPDLAIGANSFMLGGFAGVTLSALYPALPFLAVGLVLAWLLAVDLDVLQLGEESAAGLGLAVGRTRFLGVLASSLLAGAAVSFAGLLSFVGLLVPHMARRLVGGQNRWLMPASALLGAAFVLLCDVLARLVFAPFELPVGIVMSLLGGPFFLHLLLGRKRSRVV